ncbi:MAG: RDD family protein [Segniliparus sp.]|uniref:RDD family protein n=1 Tax=Segniliparus sp. TaxID=2804064 RepID=UPI003F3CBDDC
MSDPFEQMRIPREQGATPSTAPARPPAPPQQAPVQPAPPQGRRLAESAPPAPLPGPSDDPFEQMRIRPEAMQPQQPVRRAAESAPHGGAPAGAPPQEKSKTLLADVPHLRTYSGSATLGVRLLARAIDVVFVAAIAVGIWFLAAYLLEGKLVLDFSVPGYLAFALVFVALNLLYEAACSQFGGSTIGRAIFKLHVVQYNTGELMDTNTSLVRQVLPSLALLVPYAGALLAPLTYLSALWDPTRLKRDWTDRLTETTWVRRV